MEKRIRYSPEIRELYDWCSSIKASTGSQCATITAIAAKIPRRRWPSDSRNGGSGKTGAVQGTLVKGY